MRHNEVQHILQSFLDMCNNSNRYPTYKKVSKNTKFFTYYQNNSHGRWAPPAQYVIIEALDHEEADFIAERNGLYFDGYGDCRCCGNRWSPAWPDSGTDEPMIYDEKPTSKDDYKIIYRK